MALLVFFCLTVLPDRCDGTMVTGPDNKPVTFAHEKQCEAMAELLALGWAVKHQHLKVTGALCTDKPHFVLSARKA